MAGLEMPRGQEGPWEPRVLPRGQRVAGGDQGTQGGQWGHGLARDAQGDAEGTSGAQGGHGSAGDAQGMEGTSGAQGGHSSAGDAQGSEGDRGTQGGAQEDRGWPVVPKGSEGDWWFIGDTEGTNSAQGDTGWPVGTRGGQRCPGGHRGDKCCPRGCRVAGDAQGTWGLARDVQGDRGWLVVPREHWWYPGDMGVAKDAQWGHRMTHSAQWHTRWLGKLWGSCYHPGGTGWPGR